MTESEEPQHSLVMPFLGVTSNGGPWDDDAYCAGYHMGTIYTRLELEHPKDYSATIRSADVDTADLVAMKNGYQLRVIRTDWDEWVTAQFIRNDAATVEEP